MHSDIFKTAEQRTHITRRTNLLGDRTAWNKVFRKSFWDANDFTFPPELYEDAPVTLPAHFLARSVDVLSDAVYYWGEREGESLSITQRRTEPGNLEDRASSILSAASFLHDRAPSLWREFLTSALNNEIPLYVDVANEGDDGYRERLRGQVNEINRRSAMRSPTSNASSSRSNSLAAPSRAALLVRATARCRRSPP